MTDLDALIDKDMEKSAIAREDMTIRVASNMELEACKIFNQYRGYVIPYYDMEKTLLPFYRVRLLGKFEGGSYRQPESSHNYIYFPIMLNWDTVRDYIIITEGEKKAVSATKRGFPCVAIAGVHNWRNRMFTVPRDTEFDKQKNGSFKVRLPAGHFLDAEIGMQLAKGMDGFLRLIENRNLDVVICFDSDIKPVTIKQVQLAAYRLAGEIRNRGITGSKIKQMHLPIPKGEEKIGIDDLLQTGKKGVEEFAQNLRKTRQKTLAFPRLPDPKKTIGAELQKKTVTRQDTKDMALAIVSELEASGQRIRETSTGNLMYYHNGSKKLMSVRFSSQHGDLHESSFGQYLYRGLGVGENDAKLLKWIATQYAGEGDIREASVHKVFARHSSDPLLPKNTIAYQISDSQYISITDDPRQPFDIKDNGEEGVLFAQEQMEPLDTDLLAKELLEQGERELECKWAETLEGFKFHSDKQKRLASLLFYLSPWILRWRGAQMPVEIVIGEAGSGKSSLCSLRQDILIGKIRLSNMTLDLKDFYTGVSNRGGIYILDNVKFTSNMKDQQQRMSDEICRLVTEPNPQIEMRKLYTNSETHVMPVSCVIAMTAIDMPFLNMDLMQRAFIIELESLKTKHNANWHNAQIKRMGGREGWIAHHLIFLHKFLCIAKESWNPDRAGGHRLAHYEQSLEIAAQVFGMDANWISEYLGADLKLRATETDEIMSALLNFARHHQGAELYGAKEICDWLSVNIEMGNRGAFNMMTNSMSLSKYLRSHARAVKDSAYIQKAGKKNNRTVYQVNKIDNLG